MEPTYTELDDMSPNQLSEFVLEILRASEMPLTCRLTTEKALHRLHPITTPLQVTRAQERVFDALIELIRRRRVDIKSDGKANAVYVPMCRTPEVEIRIEAIIIALDGRRPDSIGDGHDPEVTITAPLSVLIGSILPFAKKES